MLVSSSSLTQPVQIIDCRCKDARHKPDAGELGSEMKTVCKAVMSCLRFVVLYGCTIGKPSGVVQMTDVICSFRNDVVFCFPEGVFTACSMRSGGIDLVINRAAVFSQVWIPLAPLKRSPIQSRTCELDVRIVTRISTKDAKYLLC